MKYFRMLKDNDSVALIKYLETNEANKILQGETLLYWAVFMNNIKFIQLLIERGANPNEIDSLDRSPLEVASFYGYLKAAKLLIENGARINAECMDRAYNGWDRNIQKEILKLFKDQGVE